MQLVYYTVFKFHTEHTLRVVQNYKLDMIPVHGNALQQGGKMKEVINDQMLTVDFLIT